MPVLASQLNPRSDEFKANAQVMRKQVEDLRARQAQVALGGGQAARDRHTARGKLLPRDRVERLLDPGTPFLEIGALAALDMYKEKDGQDAAPCAGVVAGIGRVSGVECVIVC
ncbi:MAG: carboxyl transferase domain-containing protein, partial [Burkholderiaceae bacterium]